MKTKWLKVGLLLALTVRGLVAQAQQSVDLIMDNFTSSVLSQTTTLLNNNAVMAASRNAEAERRAGRSGASAASRRVNLAYVPTAALRQQTVRDLGRQLQARNPAAGQAFTNAFGPGKTDYGQLFQQMVKQSGLPADNAATAFAAYVEIGYMIVNDVQSERAITPGMDRALQRQMTTLLGQNSKFTSPAAVAQFGEATKLQAIVLYVGWQDARKGGQASQFRSNIAQQFRRQGLDLSAVKLTEQGLARK
jgi:hypothetical protein